MKKATEPKITLLSRLLAFLYPQISHSTHTMGSLDGAALGNQLALPHPSMSVHQPFVPCSDAHPTLAFLLLPA